MDVFISYRRSASIWAESIRKCLVENNLEVFLDTHEIKNDDFFEMINWNIEEANNFLLILSEDSFRLNSGDIDYYRYEIEHAFRMQKNIVAIKVGSFNEAKVDWNNENEYIKKLKTLNNYSFKIETQNNDIAQVINLFVDGAGNKWQFVPKDITDWYKTHQLTKEDVLWMQKSAQVCDKLDCNVYKEMFNSFEWEIFENKDVINYFCLDLYDPNSLLKKINRSKEDNDFIEMSAYGFCHDLINLDSKNTIEDCNELFGNNHFIDCCKEALFEDGIKKLLKLNNLTSFDIIDCTLVLKDCENPLKVLTMLSSYLNPKGGFIFIRELDDDLLAFYPDQNRYLAEMKKLLRKDPGAGNRFLGKKIYNLLKISGAKEIYISDECVSTANCYDSSERTDICDAYFSYLEPEFKSLVKDNPKNMRYKECYDYIKANYENVLNQFRSDDFYFRSGFIAGYGFYKKRIRRN